jgi:methyl-accepting chemotaxis protein
MKWFNNLKISQKLITSFLIISVFVCITGGIGITNMRKLNENSSEMYNSYLLGVSDMRGIKEQVLEINSDIQLLIYKQDNSQTKKY